MVQGKIRGRREIKISCLQVELLEISISDMKGTTSKCRIYQSTRLESPSSKSVEGMAAQSGPDGCCESILMFD